MEFFQRKAPRKDEESSFLVRWIGNLGVIILLCVSFVVSLGFGLRIGLSLSAVPAALLVTLGLSLAIGSRRHTSVAGIVFMAFLAVGIPAVGFFLALQAFLSSRPSNSKSV